MRLAIVGTRDLEGNAEALKVIRDALDRYQPSLVVSGGAEGVDQMAEWEALRRGIFVESFYPCRVEHRHTFRECYAPRNLKIATACDRLVRIASKASRSYGSGWTRDKARELGKPTEEHLIDA